MSLDNLPVEWLSLELGKVIDYGKTSKVEPINVDDNTWVLELEDIEKDTSKILNTVYFAERKSKSTKNKFIKGDVLYGKLRPYLNKVVVAPQDGICTTEVIPLNGNGSILNKFLFYWLKGNSFQNYVQAVSYGVNMPRLGTNDGLKAPFVLAPLAEQQEIVRQLDVMLAQVEQIKTRLDAIPVILKKFRQSVLADAVSGKLPGNHDIFKEIIVENTWKHSIYGLDHWKEYKFSDVVDIVGGSQPPKSDFRPEYQNGYIRLIQIRDYKSDSHIVYIPKEKAKRFVNSTDVMIGRYGPPIFQILRGLEGAYNVALMKAEPKDQLIDQEYLYWFLQNYKIYNYIEAGSDRTAGQSGVNKKHLEAYPILLPPIDEQQDIVKEIVRLTTLANRIEEAVKSAQKRVNLLTQSILAKAFSGELTTEWREQHQALITGVNSAESLLANIQAEREASKPVKKTRVKKDA